MIPTYIIHIVVATPGEHLLWNGIALQWEEAKTNHFLPGSPTGATVLLGHFLRQLSVGDVQQVSVFQIWNAWIQIHKTCKIFLINILKY